MGIIKTKFSNQIKMQIENTNQIDQSDAVYSINESELLKSIANTPIKNSTSDNDFLTPLYRRIIDSHINNMSDEEETAIYDDETKEKVFTLCKTNENEQNNKRKITFTNG